ncbi:MAG: signal transduction histidine kinase [Bacteroidetes bacterium]|nr:MAG: signal transduction histidine kinase [Bacteroidota bacterium]
MAFHFHRLFILLLLSAVTLRGIAQEPAKRRARTDSLFRIATDTSNPLDQRMKAFSRITYEVYNDFRFGKQISLAYLRAAQSGNRPKDEMNALNFLGVACMAAGDLDSAGFCFEREFDLSVANNDPRRKNEALGNLGNLAEAKGDLGQSLNYHFQSLAIDTVYGLKKERARAWINIGHIYELQGRYKESIVFLQKAREFIAQYKLYGYSASLYIHLGEVNRDIGEDTVAENYFRKALRSAILNHNEGKRTQALEQLAGLFEQRGWNDSAISYYTVAYKVAEKEQLKSYMATTQCGMGRIHFAKGDYAEAKARATASIAIFCDNAIASRLEEAQLLAGKAAFRLGKYEESRVFLEKAHELAEKNKRISSLQLTCYALYELYKKNGDDRKSLAYLEKYQLLFAAQKNEDALKSVMKQEIKNNFRRKQVTDSLHRAQEAAAMEQKHRETERVQERNMYIAFGVIVVLVLTVLLGYYLYRQKRKSHLLLAEKNVQIEQALKDKEILLREVHHRVKNNMQVVSSLLLLKSRNTADATAREALLDSQSRIASMQLAHQKMYEEGNYESIDLTLYVREIAQLMIPGGEPDAIACRLDGEKALIHVEQAQSVGFILHELITNSIRHAWEPAATGKKINIRIVGKEKNVQIDYADNGKGLVQGFDLCNARSFGLRLINSLVERQLMGILRPGEGSGFNVIIEFKNR